MQFAVMSKDSKRPSKPFPPNGKPLRSGSRSSRSRVASSSDGSDRRHHNNVVCATRELGENTSGNPASSRERKAHARALEHGGTADAHHGAYLPRSPQPEHRGQIHS